MEIGEIMKPIIEVRNLCKRYDGEIIIENLSFDIYQNEILVILGASGAGKTTLMNILSKQDEVYEGAIHYDSTVFNRIKVPLPIVFQDFEQLLPWYTVKKNILLPYERTRFTKHDEALLKFIGIEDHLHKRPSQLSGGMKQRVAIARALMSDAKIIFMDEPFGSLDPQRRLQLQELILQLNRTYHKTIVFITHDREEAHKIASRIGIIKNDKTFEVSKVDEVRQ